MGHEARRGERKRSRAHEQHMHLPRNHPQRPSKHRRKLLALYYCTHKRQLQHCIRFPSNYFANRGNNVPQLFI